MIIKLPLMLHNIVSKQFKISHVPCNVITFKKEDIPANISKLIVDQYDEKFLEDCDMVMFVKGPIDKDMRKKIFKACDKALGEGANMMNETDFRLLNLHDDDTADFGADDEEKDEEQKIDDQVKDIVNEPDDEEKSEDKEEEEDDGLGLEDNAEAIADSLEESDDKDDDKSKSDDEKEEDDEKEDDKEENDAGEDDAEDSSSEQEKEVPTRYVFLKISMKS